MRYYFQTFSINDIQERDILLDLVINTGKIFVALTTRIFVPSNLHIRTAHFRENTCGSNSAGIR
jgi:hypothetical protein